MQPRVPLHARLRVRAAGSSGLGRLCRVHDSSARGVRLSVDGRIGPGWEVLEVLTEDGQPYEEPLEVRVVWVEEPTSGDQQLGCVFDL